MNLLEIVVKIEKLISHEKLDLAQEKLVEALSFFPEYDYLHTLQAEIHIRNKQFDLADKAINEAIGLNPENDRNYYLKSEVLTRLDKKEEALVAIDQAIYYAPEYAALYGRKASIYLSMDHLEGARDTAKQGLELDPNDLLSNNIYSLALTKLGEKDLAADHLNLLLKDDPNNTLTHSVKGLIHLQNGEIAKAKEHFGVALTNDPNDEIARGGMAEAIKGSNFFYAKLLQFSFWMEKFSSKARWAMIIGVIILVRVVPILAPFYLILVFWTWFTGPISEVLLYFDKFGRYLLSEFDQKKSIANTIVLGVSILCGLSSFFLGFYLFIPALSLFLGVLPIYALTDTTFSTKTLIKIGYIAFFIGIGLFGIVGPFLNMDISPILTYIILGGVSYTWVNSYLQSE